MTLEMIIEEYEGLIPCEMLRVSNMANRISIAFEVDFDKAVAFLMDYENTAGLHNTWTKK